ncbi:hypothetical protein ACFQZ4_51645 [Catellatospora coxensis]
MSPSWLRELLLGARMALAGGRSGLARAALTAVGVGLGVAMLLAAVSIPHMMQARSDRGASRADQNYGTQVERTDRSTLVGETDMAYRTDGIRGRLLQAEGADPALPPGLTALPRPGEMAVSPALARLLLSPDGALLRERLHYPATAIIGDKGLQGPGELAFYLGSDKLTADTPASAGATPSVMRTPAKDWTRCCCSWSSSSSWCCCCPWPCSSPRRSASAATAATGGWPGCAWSARTPAWPGVSPPARRC